MRLFGRIAVLCVVLLALGAGSAEASRTDDRSKPVIFIHGFDPHGESGVDCWGQFNPMRARLWQLGFTGRMVTLGFYDGDYNCSAYINSEGGNPGAHFASGHSEDGGHDAIDTDMRHLAYHIAWYVYNHYSSKGIAVDMVGLSMGGLPIRYMLGRVERHHPDFPPKLKIEDAITQGAAHGGFFEQPWSCEVGAECPAQQRAQEMLDWMEEKAWEPDGAGGTDWTAYGSDYDKFVGPSSAVGVNGSRTAHKYFGACHKVIWAEEAQIDHVGFVYDISMDQDLVVDKEKSGTCTGKLVTKSGFRHPVAEAARALQYGTH